MFYTSKIPNSLHFTQEKRVNCDIFGKQLSMEEYKLRDKKNALFQALPELPPPSSGNLYNFFPTSKFKIWESISDYIILTMPKRKHFSS